MIKSSLNLLSTQTAKDTSIIFLGTIVNVIAGGLFFIFTPRLLGPSDYGIFTLVISSAIFATNVANLGIDSGILKFATNKNFFNKVLSLAFKSYIFLGITIFLVGFLISPAIANYLREPKTALYLRIAFGSVLILLLTNFYIAALQARKEFLKASFLNVSSNILRILILALATYFFKINLYFVTILFFLSPVISVVFGNILLKFKFQKEDKSFTKNFFGYNLWIGASLIIASIPLENYILLKVAGPVAVGIYAAPYKLLTFVHQFAGNFSRILASRFASFDNRRKVLIYSWKSSLMVLLFSLFLTLTIPVAPFITRLLFGEDFIASQNVYRILTVAFIFFFASTIPTAIILYYLGKSNISFYLTLARSIILTVSLLLFVQKYQATGAAVSLLLAEFTTFTLATAYSFIKLRK